jgi:hypothetical protein
VRLEDEAVAAATTMEADVRGDKGLVGGGNGGFRHGREVEGVGGGGHGGEQGRSRRQPAEEGRPGRRPRRCAARLWRRIEELFANLQS